MLHSGRGSRTQREQEHHMAYHLTKLAEHSGWKKVLREEVKKLEDVGYANDGRELWKTCITRKIQSEDTSKLTLPLETLIAVGST